MMEVKFWKIIQKSNITYKYSVYYTFLYEVKYQKIKWFLFEIYMY